MPVNEQQSSFLGRISIRRNQVNAMDGCHEQELEDLEIFHKQVADHFSELLNPPPPPTPTPSDDAASAAPTLPPLLSISWLRKLLDAFLCCDAEFKALMLMGCDPAQISKPPLDRVIPDLLDRSVKALDICNAVTNGVEAVRHCQRLSEIAVSALENRPVGDGQVKRARKALSSLVASINIDDKESSSFKTTERTWSFSRRGTGTNKDQRSGQFRTLSWQVGKNWSASKQIQAMTSNLVAPRGAEASGLASAVYTMSTVLSFVMWAMVAAIPCQERSGLATHFPVQKQLTWAHSMVGLADKIGEDWKKKEKKGTAGLLEEMQKLEKLGQSLMEFADSFQFPGETEKIEESAAQVAELAETCRKMEEGLLPLQLQVREVFHRIVRSRAEFLEALENPGKGAGGQGQ